MRRGLDCTCTRGEWERGMCRGGVCICCVEGVERSGQ